jgi:hypothetical protein
MTFSNTAPVHLALDRLRAERHPLFLEAKWKPLSVFTLLFAMYVTVHQDLTCIIDANRIY